MNKPKHWIITTAIIAVGLLIPQVAAAQLRGGGGGAKRPAGGGMQRPAGGGMQRPAGGMQRPTSNGISRPTPTMPRPQPNLPQVNRPNVTRPNVAPPNITKPNIDKPSISRPNMPQDRPNLGGGLKPSNKLPTDKLPTDKLPGDITRPGNKLPGTTERPTTLPGLSGRPINLPNKPERPIDRPVARPLPGDLDDFLGIHRPSRPETKPAPRPNLPNNIGNNIGNNNGNNIGNNIGNKVGINNNISNNNVVISTRPNWSNRPGVGNISNSWNNALIRPTRPINSWASLSPGRYQYWNSWGTSVRAHWSSYHYNWFGNGWWNQHYHPIGGWHYYWYHQSLPVAYWWRRPTYAAVTSWFVWTAPTQVWQTPIYYDYGTGGNVYYEDNSVYIGGQAIGTREDFAASAAVLATVEPPADETAAENAEWMPLGTFAVTSDRRETKPTRSIQLAVNRDGVVSGTFYNESTDQAQTVLGQVDRDTQRVALRIGENEDVIVETGLYNLTQDETPVLVHFGAEKNETWLLVRLDAPEEEATGESSND